jgi:putative transposase
MSGNFLDSLVLPADMDERVCALALLLQVKKQAWSQNLHVVFADSGFAGEGFQRQIQTQTGLQLTIVKRNPDAVGFQVLPKRWLIEQVFGCWGRNRRLSRDYEQQPRHSRATLQVASIHRFLNSIQPKPQLPPFKYKSL